MIITKTLRQGLLVLAFFGMIQNVDAHDNKTIHPTITDLAYNSWFQKDAGKFFDRIGITKSDSLSLTSVAYNRESRGEGIVLGSTAWSLTGSGTLKDWLIAGSVDEDAPDTRCLAHFYNPLGLYSTGAPHYLTDPINVSGRDSFEWASTGISFEPASILFKPSSGTNLESWIKAREYYYDALTKGAKAERKEKLAHTFYALGKVCHLLQDLSQPEHVRNDAHMINGRESPLVGNFLGDIIADARWIENYGRDNYRRTDPLYKFELITEGQTLYTSLSLLPNFDSSRSSLIESCRLTLNTLAVKWVLFSPYLNDG